jgi:thioredoxin 1
MAEITLTSSNFEAEVLNSELPVLVDFWATWCGPCKMIAPVVAEIAKEYEGKVKVGKVNVDEENALAMQYRVASIPTHLLFKNGQVVNTSVGYLPKQAIIEKLGL